MISEFHPLIIHFPIALFSVAILFDLLFLIFNKKDFYTGGWWTMLFALISGTAATITGFLDDKLIGHFTFKDTIWNTHGLVQLFSFIIFLGLFTWRTKDRLLFHNTIKKTAYTLTSSLGLFFLYYGSHLGAILSGRI